MLDFPLNPQCLFRLTLCVIAAVGPGYGVAAPKTVAARIPGNTIIFDQNNDDFGGVGFRTRLCGDIPDANTWCGEKARLGKDALGLFRANTANPASPFIEDNSPKTFEAPYVDTAFGRRVDRYRFTRWSDANTAIGLPSAPPTLISVYAAPDMRSNVVSLFLNDNDGLTVGSSRTITGNMNFQNADMVKPFANPNNKLRLRVDILPKWAFRFPDVPIDLRTVARSPGDFPSVQINTAIQFYDSVNGRNFYYNLINFDQNRITKEIIMMDDYQGIPMVQVALNPLPNGQVASQYAEILPDNDGPSLTHVSHQYRRFSIQLSHGLFLKVLKDINATIAAKRLGKPFSENPRDYQVVLAGTGGEIGHPIAGRGICGLREYAQGGNECVTKLGFSVKNFRLSYGTD